MTPATLERPGALPDDLMRGVEMAKRTAAERFWERVDRNGPVPDYRPDLGPCWLWTGQIGHGYGVANLDNKRWRAHRYSYTTLVGPIPEGLVIDHLCRVTRCVNPAHLEPVTNRENTLRGVGLPAVNAVKDSCHRGHPFTPENTYVFRGVERRCKECHNQRVREYRIRKRAKEAAYHQFVEGEKA